MSKVILLCLSLITNTVICLSLIVCHSYILSPSHFTLVSHTVSISVIFLICYYVNLSDSVFIILLLGLLFSFSTNMHFCYYVTLYVSISVTLSVTMLVTLFVTLFVTLYVTLSVTVSLCYYVCHNFTLLRCLILYLLLC